MWWAGYSAPLEYWGSWHEDYPGSGWAMAERKLSDDERDFSISKVTYKFTANPSASRTLHWFEAFVPEDDPETEDVNESQLVEILAERTWTLAALRGIWPKSLRKQTRSF